jgi:HEAT repeat protein
MTVAKGLTTDSDERKARIGVELLAAVGSPDALEAVGPYLTDERVGVRIQALVALNGRAPANWKQAVLDRRKDPNPLVRAVAARIDPGR